MAEPDLPYVDTHALTIGAPIERVWTVLEDYAATIGAAKTPMLGRVLGAEPMSGFAVVHRDAPHQLALAGRHRFSRYRLTFELDPAPGGGTLLRALTHAVFPGVRGAVYRALVIGTRLHVLATRGMLHAVGRRAMAPTAGVAPST
ncbi:MAG: hypothetical protein IPH07_27465 [Deltaproteobacteria bacterium]|nr:hypothetical protein [Deltaproteobacteria bacterium]MBK8714632.1 hypothetical protein [Deltaproteobacteria bacterium]MBP7292229.1 hypothetical protein [Nannocystaceae bacterium]